MTQDGRADPLFEYRCNGPDAHEVEEQEAFPDPGSGGDGAAADAAGRPFA